MQSSPPGLLYYILESWEGRQPNVDPKDENPMVFVGSFGAIQAIINQPKSGKRDLNTFDMTLIHVKESQYVDGIFVLK